MRISDWSSDVCSSDLMELLVVALNVPVARGGANGLVKIPISLDHGRNVCRRDSIVERRAMPGHGREVAVIPAPGGQASGDSLDQLECLQVLIYVLQAQGRNPGRADGAIGTASSRESVLQVGVALGDAVPLKKK